MESMVCLDTETVTAGDLLQETGDATFSFPLSSGIGALLSETLPSGPLAINNCRMPARAVFRSQIHSTLHQHFVLGRASLHPGTLGEWGCWTSLPKQHPETAPRDRLGGSSHCWALEQLCELVWAWHCKPEVSWLGSKIVQVLEIVQDQFGLQHQWLLQRSKHKKTEELNQGTELKALVLCRDSEDGVWGSSSFLEGAESSSTV